MSKEIILGLFGAMGGFYVLFITGTYLVISRLSKLEAHIGHEKLCHGRIRGMMKLLVKKYRGLKKRMDTYEKGGINVQSKLQLIGGIGNPFRRNGYWPSVADILPTQKEGQRQKG